MLTHWLWTICFMATGFVLVVQHFRLDQLERWKDHIESLRPHASIGWGDGDHD